MVEYLLLILQICMFLTALVFLPILFIYRVILVIRYKKDILTILLITLIPFSIGYFHFLKEEEKTKTYNILITVLFLLSFLGISFTLFQHLIPRYDYF